MKLGEGGEAFFVFETSDEIPESLQTSPVISPATSPQSLLEQDVASVPTLQELEFLDLNTDGINDRRGDAVGRARPVLSDVSRAKSDFGVCHMIPRICRNNDRTQVHSLRCMPALRQFQTMLEVAIRQLPKLRLLRKSSALLRQSLYQRSNVHKAKRTAIIHKSKLMEANRASI